MAVGLTDHQRRHFLTLLARRGESTYPTLKRAATQFGVELSQLKSYLEFEYST